MEKTKSLCSGCYCNDYNNGLGGSKECWSYEGAIIIDRIRIPLDMPPPYKKSWAQPMMSCYRTPGYVHVLPERIREDGYWND